MRYLLDNQKEAIAKLNRLKVGALFMACGTGKTQVAVELINSVAKVDLLLWICPFQTKENLKRELEKCSLAYHPLIIGVESISQSGRIYLETLEKIKQSKNAFLVVDESLKIKNITAKRTNRLILVGEYAKYKLILNGTPITKNILDIYAQMRFLSPKILGVNFYKYRDTFCKYTAKKDPSGRIKEIHIYGYENVDYLLSIIEPYVYQCRMILPMDKKYQKIDWDLTAVERVTYDTLKRELLRLIGTNSENLLGVFQKLQHSYSMSKRKFEVIKDLVDSKTIIFCKFIKTQTSLQALYPNNLILTYGKNSIGLNLQAYNKIIYFDKTFDYAFREQSEARIYREGQAENCEYFDLTGELGLEKMIDECIVRKTSLVEHFKKNCKVKDL